MGLQWYLKDPGHGDERWLAALRERVTADPRLWIKEYNGGDSICVGWNDDRTGGYHVAFGLEHRVEWPEEALRAFGYMTYTAGDEQSTIGRRDERVGEHWFDPPYARDVVLQVDVLMVWLDAHRRTLDHLPAAEPDCDG